VVFDDKIWLLGGLADGRGNASAVWFSSDGKTWTEAVSDVIWKVRHEPSCLVFKNRLWVMGGYTDGGLLNDVWSTDAGH